MNYKPRNKTRKYKGRGEELKKIFPQFLAGDNGDCFEQVAADLVVMDPFYMRVHGWSHWYQDLGQKELCNSLPDSKYLLAHWNATDIPYLFPTGACVPSSCATNTSFANSVRLVVNKYLAAILREAQVIYNWDELVQQVDPNDSNQNYWKYFASIVSSKTELAIYLPPQEDETK